MHYKLWPIKEWFTTQSWMPFQGAILMFTRDEMMLQKTAWGATFFDKNFCYKHVFSTRINFFYRVLYKARKRECNNLLTPPVYSGPKYSKRGGGEKLAVHLQKPLLGKQERKFFFFDVVVNSTFSKMLLHHSKTFVSNVETDAFTQKPTYHHHLLGRKKLHGELYMYEFTLQCLPCKTDNVPPKKWMKKKWREIQTYSSKKEAMRQNFSSRLFFLIFSKTVSFHGTCNK